MNVKTNKLKLRKKNTKKAKNLKKDKKTPGKKMKGGNFYWIQIFVYQLILELQVEQI